MEKQVKVAEYLSWSRAHIARSKLESEGIPCILSGDHMNTMYGSPVALIVPKEAWEHAVAVLADLDFNNGPLYL